MSQTFNVNLDQQPLDFSVQPPNKITSDQIAAEIQLMMKAVAKNRMGATKPADIQNGEIWCKTLADGTFQLYRWVTADGSGDGTAIATLSTTTVRLLSEASDVLFPTEKAVAAVVDFVRANLQTSIDSASSQATTAFEKAESAEDVATAAQGTANTANSNATTALTAVNNKLDKSGGTTTGALNIGIGTATDQLYLSHILGLITDSASDYIYMQSIRNRANYDDVSLIINRLYGGGSGTVSLLDVSPLRGIGSAAFSQRIPAPVPTSIQALGHMLGVGIGGSSYAIPAGGTYFYHIIGFNSSGAYVGTQSGFAAGGTTITVPNAEAISIFAWRFV